MQYNFDESEAFGKFVESTGISPEPVRAKVHRAVVGVAAALFLPAAIVAFLSLDSARNSHTEWQQVSTSLGESRNITLDDGTAVRLSACSNLICPDRFIEGERRVFVSGEAFFDVAKDEDRPFVVTAGQFDVKVHGTRFNLRSFAKDAEDEVALVEGSVSIEVQGRTLDMHPGELVRYDKATSKFTRSTFSANYYEEALKSDGLVFNNMQLRDIANVLSNRFGTEIILEDKDAGLERFYASFINNESLDEILLSLNTRNHLKITRDGDTIRIWRRGKTN